MRVPRLARHVCGNCGEVFFDLDASRKIGEVARASLRLKRGSKHSKVA